MADVPQPVLAGRGLGFVSLTLLLLVMRIAGVFGFENVALQGTEIAKCGTAYAAVFVLVALVEESLSFGYILFTLSTGIGFGYAALLLSAAFALLHFGNRGETWMGVLNAGLSGILSCLLLRRTGDLWMAIGYHAAWDWGQTYFYGVPNSGRMAQGHLFNTSISGPVWLSGGSVGPEGSVLCTLLLVTLYVVVCLLFRQAKYPGIRGGTAPPDATCFVADDSGLQSEAGETPEAQQEL